MQRRIVRFSSLALALLALSACSGRHDRREEGQASGAPAQGGGAPAQAGGSLTLKGSDTMVILAQKWAERFMQDHAGATVQVSGGGSGTGIAALLNGTTDLANSSRPIKDREREDLRAQRHVEAIETRVALDALAVYVNTASPLQALTIAQIKSIYRGTVTNWREVGGPNAPIVLYSRENNSGTYAYFKEHVLGGEDFAATAQTLPGTAAVINSVARDPNGIGYGGIAYGTGVRALRIRLEDGREVEPTMANAVAGTYPISRFLYVYSAGEPTGLARAYLDFVLSPAGQSLIEGVGYFPLPTGAAAPAPAPAPAPAAAPAPAPAPAAQ